MGFGKRKDSQSYGVPVRSAAPAAPSNLGPTQVSAPAGQPGAGFYAPAAAAPVVGQYPFTPGASAYVPPTGYAAAAPNAYAQPAYAPVPSGYAPPPYGQQSWAPTPPGYAAPPKSNVPRNVIIGVVLAVVGLPFFAAIAIPVFLNTRTVRLPSTLAGRTRMSDDALKSMGDIKDQVRRSGAKHVSFAIYQEANGAPAIVVVASRGPLKEQKEIANASNGFPIDTASRQEFDGVACYAARTAPVALCIWSADVSGMVIVFNSTVPAAATITKEAKRAVK